MTNPDADVALVNIVLADNNMCDENKADIITEYYNGYLLADSYVVANENITETEYNCEPYFDNSFEEQTADAVLAFYDENGRLVNVKIGEFEISSSKTVISIDIEDIGYDMYKLML